MKRSIFIMLVFFLVFFTNFQVAWGHTQEQNNDRSSTPSTAKKVRPDDSSRSSDRARESKNKQQPLDFSDTGRPGQQTAGESRGECIYTEHNLSAVIPTSHSGKTTLGNPRFWVYFPYTRQQVSQIEFVIQNEAREDVWRSQVKNRDNQGYRSFSMPATAAPLEVDRWYRWYVKVYCGRDRDDSTDYVQGWVRRVPLLSQMYLELQQESMPSHKIYGEGGIWYDAIDNLLTLYKSDPGNMRLERDWHNLIEAQGVSLDFLPQVGASYKANELN